MKSQSDIDRVTDRCAIPIDIQVEHDIVELRGHRRVLAEQLRDAVRARDGGAMQLMIARLSRLGVQPNMIMSIVRDALAS